MHLFERFVNRKIKIFSIFFGRAARQRRELLSRTVRRHSSAAECAAAHLRHGRAARSIIGIICARDADESAIRVRPSVLGRPRSPRRRIPRSRCSAYRRKHINQKTDAARETLYNNEGRAKQLCLLYCPPNTAKAHFV